MKEESKHLVKDDAIKTLTPRETEVFYMLLNGMKAKEIAAKTSVTVWGANYYIKQIYRKLSVHSKVDLVLQYYNYRQP
ncbi:MAG: helix-turn-helix transcriptional regulator [Anaerovoracaceae bacterium]|jgi:DNA-binding CsgD family transcriptional regulator